MAALGARAGVAYIDVRGDFSTFDKQVNNTGKTFGGKFAKFGKVAGAGIAAAAGGFGILAKSSIDAASDINESLSKNQKLFGKYAKGVENFASTSAKSYGISKKAALEYTGVFGNLFRSMGLSEKASASQSVALTKLAADMASFNNTSPEEALEAIRSGLVGETEPLRKFGVNMNDATLKAQALKMGLISSTKDALTPQQKALAASAVITKQTSQAHGDFARTSGGLANQQKILKARFEDAKAALGQRLLPAALAVTKAFNDSGPVIDSLKAKLGGLFAPGGGGDLAARAKPVLDSLKLTVTDGFSGLSASASAIWRTFGGGIVAELRNRANTMIGILNSFIQVFRGIINVISGVLTGDWRRVWNGIKQIFGGVWSAIKTIVTSALNTIRNSITNVTAAIRVVVSGAWNAIRGATSGAWNAIRGATSSAWGAVRSFIGGAISGARDRVRDVLSNIREIASNAWSAIKNGAGNFAEGFKDKIVGAFKSAANQVVSFVNKIIGVVNKIPGVNIGKVSGFARGGVIEAYASGGSFGGYAKGGMVKRPTVIMGEEAPRHPEYVIPTNPAYRDRARALLQSAAGKLGVRAYKKGGVIAKAASVGDILSGGLDLITKGPKALLNTLPSPSSLGWLKGLGSIVLKGVGDWIKDKVENLIPKVGGGGGIKVGTNALAALLAKMFGLTISSGYRDPKRNAAAGGAPNSSHMKGSPSNPGAHDFVPPTGPAGTQGRAGAFAVSKMGAKWADNHDFGSGLHQHVSWFHKGGWVKPPGADKEMTARLARGEYVMDAGLASQVANGGGSEFHIYIGDQEITELVRVEVSERDRSGRGRYLAGVAG